MTSTGPTVRRRRLGTELRRLREQAGLTLAETARHVETSDSTMSRIENGRGRVRRTDLLTLLDLYGIQDAGHRESLVRLARDARTKGWWQNYGDVISEPYGDYISLETAARAQRIYTIQLIPGLLQTSDYTRALAESWLGWQGPQDIERFVTVRAQRQTVLTGPTPLKLWAVISEAALRTRVGGPDVMSVQLEHLRDIARLPHVTIQVLPDHIGGHPMMDQPFILLDFAALSDPDVVCLEHLTGALYVEKEEDVQRYVHMFDHLRSAALSPLDSLAAITDQLKELR